VTVTDSREVLEKLAAGEIDIDTAERLLRLDYVEKIGNHTVFDMSRECRSGIPEVVYAEGKTPEKAGEIAERVIAKKACSCCPAPRRSTTKRWSGA